MNFSVSETSCPCPLQGCQKNVHTGPLTGIISKGPVKQHSTPLSPVALSLPKEPQDIRSLPSPARGSAGCRPTPSPAIATAKNPSCWSENTDCSYDTTGLLAISRTTEDSVRLETKTRCKNGMKSARCEMKKKNKKFKSRKITKHICKQDENQTIDGYRMNGRPFYTNVMENDTVGLIASVTDYVSRKPAIVEVCESDVCDENVLVEQTDDQKCKKYRKRRSVEDELEKDMLRAYPVMRENVQKNNVHVPDDEQVIKKPKLDEMVNGDEKPVDVEKNNYLSALQLCSVNNADDKLDEIEKDALSISENFAPRKREEESVKIPAKPVETADQTTQSRDTVEEEIADVAPSPKSATSICRTPNIEPKKPPRLRRKRWTNKKKNKKKSSKAAKSSEEEKIEAENAEKIRRAELLSLTQKRASSKLKWSNGWSWLGEPFVSKVFLNVSVCWCAFIDSKNSLAIPKLADQLKTTFID